MREELAEFLEGGEARACIACITLLSALLMVVAHAPHTSIARKWRRLAALECSVHACDAPLVGRRCG